MNMPISFRILADSTFLRIQLRRAMTNRRFLSRFNADFHSLWAASAKNECASYVLDYGDFIAREERGKERKCMPKNRHVSSLYANS